MTPSRQKSSTSSSASLLRLDTALLYRDGVGAEGIDPEDLERLAPELRRAHQALVAGSADGLEAEYACLTLHDSMPGSLPAIEAAAEQLRRFENIAVIGIGGSSLGAKAALQALVGEPGAGRPRLHFLENIDPRNVDVFMRRCTAATAAVLCISKSGGTIETAAQFMIL